MRNREHGESLVEVCVAVAIVAVTFAAMFGAILAAAHRFGPDSQAIALQHAVENEMRAAVDIAKYQGATLTPNVVATTVPLPSGTPLPAHLALAESALPSGGVFITLTASSDADANERASISATVAVPAPLPSSLVTVPGSAAAPVGAP